MGLAFTTGDISPKFESLCGMDGSSNGAFINHVTQVGRPGGVCDFVTVKTKHGRIRVKVRSLHVNADNCGYPHVRILQKPTFSKFVFTGVRNS